MKTDQNTIDEQFLDGYIILSRKLLGSQLWSCSDSTFRVAVYLLLTANHKPRFFKRIEIKRGQTCRSLSTISHDCGISIKAVRYSIDILVRDGFITKDHPFGASKGHRLTVCNYDTYQNPEIYRGTRGAPEGQQRGTRGAPNNNVIMQECKKNKYIGLENLSPSEKSLFEKWLALREEIDGTPLPQISTEKQIERILRIQQSRRELELNNAIAGRWKNITDTRSVEDSKNDAFEQMILSRK